MILRILSVAVGGALAGGFAIPAGFLLRLNPLMTYIAATTGAIVFTSVILLGGGAFRDRLVSRLGSRSARAAGRARRIVDRYGARGLGVIGPVFPGVTASCLLGLGLGVDARSLTIWMAAGTAGLYAIYTVFWWLIVTVT